MKPGGRGVQVKFVKVVKHVESRGACFGDRSRGQRACPIPLVDVAPDSHYRRYRPQSINYFRFAHIAGMDDQIRPAQGVQSLIPQ